MLHPNTYNETNNVAYVPIDDSDQPGLPPNRCTLTGWLRTWAIFMSRTAKAVIRLCQTGRILCRFFYGFAQI